MRPQPSDQRPEWWEPGMSARDIAIWESAERCAASAPELRPGDEAYERVRQILGGCLAPSVRREDRDAA